ncbi:lipase [Aquincola sp. S2]|uniref:Lipase n=1 Tax=Pseudaquabacterium terrae TaxID=2732868 RepID=A0ABX2EUI3_9BURK|nr:GDSL-type esterase/lipase family protein [Aquabacterium terrae]NRF72316.1 lipase [Aquabacterium terrae]
MDTPPTADHRICFFGDSMTQGTADPQCRGWVGRVCEAARVRGIDVTCFNLGVRGDTSRDVRQRWEAECAVRFTVPCATHVLFSFGANDMTLQDGALRVGYDESVANLQAMVVAARQRHAVLVVGPSPVNEPEQDERIVALCRRYEASAQQLQLPYLPIVRTLMSNQRWRGDVAASDGCHPGALGYELMASLVQRWPAWWFADNAA